MSVMVMDNLFVMQLNTITITIATMMIITRRRVILKKMRRQDREITRENCNKFGHANQLILESLVTHKPEIDHIQILHYKQLDALFHLPSPNIFAQLAQSVLIAIEIIIICS